MPHNKEITISNHKNTKYEEMTSYPDLNNGLQIRKEEIINRIKSLTEIKFNPCKQEPPFSNETLALKNHRLMMEQDANYSIFIDEAIYAILVSDEKGLHFEANAVACDLFGYSKEELHNLTITDLMFKEDIASSALKMTELASGKILKNEKRFKRKNGTEFYAEVNAKMLLNGLNIIFMRELNQA